MLCIKYCKYVYISTYLNVDWLKLHYLNSNVKFKNVIIVHIWNRKMLNANMYVYVYDFLITVDIDNIVVCSIVYFCIIIKKKNTM